MPGAGSPNHAIGDNELSGGLGTIQRLGQGRCLEELAEALAVVAERVVETGQPGTVTLRLQVKAVEGQGHVMVAVEETIAMVPPRRKAKGTIMYAVDGGLYPRDPRQPELPLRAVHAPAPEARELDAAEPELRQV